MLTKLNTQDRSVLNILDALDNRRLMLIIMPTERCNFRCTYCYEDFAQGKMTEAIKNRIKLFINKRINGLEHIVLSWFGGEPFLASDIVEDIQQHVFNNKGKNTSMHSVATTNGYFLNKPLFEKFISCGLNTFSISLDGLGDIHNSTRRHANHSIDTFSTIWKNLIDMRDSNLNFTVMIRIHHYPSNMGHIEEFIDALNTEFFSDDRFFPYVEPILDLGGPDRAIHYSSSIVAEKDADYIRSILPKKELFDRPSYICYAASPNSLVIRQNGRIAKCTVALNSDDNDIGYIDEDGSLVIDEDKINFWISPLLRGDGRGMTCPEAYHNGHMKKNVEPLNYVPKIVS